MSDQQRARGGTRMHQRSPHQTRQTVPAHRIPPDTPSDGPRVALPPASLAAVPPQLASRGRRMPQRPPARRRYRRGNRRGLTIAVITGAAVLALGVVFVLSHLGAATGAGQYPYAVGSPGPGAAAPAIDLASTSGGTFDLASQRGKTVLLYFQEGLTCEPCWTQLKDLDTHMSQVRALGIDEVVSITTDPLDALTQKVHDEHITSPVLSDPTLAVSRAYSASQYGMMGASRDGHTFIVVGPNGYISWRADYGGAPNYTMYVPVPTLLAAMRSGLQTGSR